jgi:hypothetical protein
VASAEDVVNAMNSFEIGDDVTIKYVRIVDGKAVERSVKVQLK